jgi:hypothetical protein
MSGDPKNPDIQLIDDIATGEHLLRLHLDIPLPPEKFNAVRALLLQEKLPDSRVLAQLIDSEPVSPYLDLFFNPPT